MKSTSLCGLLSILLLTQLSSAVIKINPWDVKNLLKPEVSFNLAKSYASSLMESKKLGSTLARFSVCENDAGLLELENTSDPPAPVKGQTVSIHMDGVSLDSFYITDVFVTCLWNEVGLLAEDYPTSNPQELLMMGDNWSDVIVWDVPGFAPDGHYHITVEVNGKRELTDASKEHFACITADFDFP